MPRAHSIWIAVSDGNPIAAFTVKHELKTWLSEFDRNSAAWLTLQVFKLPDSPSNYSADRHDIEHVWDLEDI
jgi:hypothetical protein